MNGMPGLEGGLAFNWVDGLLFLLPVIPVVLFGAIGKLRWKQVVVWSLVLLALQGLVFYLSFYAFRV